MKIKISLDESPFYGFNSLNYPFGSTIDIPKEKLKEWEAAHKLFLETIQDIEEFMRENYPDVKLY